MEDKNKEMIDKADKFYDEKKYEEAFEICQPLAEGGDLHAMWRLGLMYNRGESIKQDYQEAFKWYEKAAHQGFANAQLSLGFMYAGGKGIKQDKKEGLKWIKKSRRAWRQENAGLCGKDIH